MSAGPAPPVAPPTASLDPLGYTVAISHAFRPLDAEPRLLAYVARLKARPAVGNLLDLELPPLA